IDLWILELARETFEDVNEYFKAYEFSKALQELNFFLRSEFSAIYLDLCKDNLYCNAPISKERKASQSAMALIGGRLFGLLAPILTYTINEALSYTQSQALLESCGISVNKDVFEVFYTPLPTLSPKQDFTYLLALRSAFLEQVDSLKKDSKIKSTLEIDLVLPKTLNFAELNTWLMVSSVTQKSEEEVLGIFILEGEEYILVKARGYKCPRCWQYTAKNEGDTCLRCSEVLKCKGFDV
ncbi:MAG: class I tRNA ligase family protein, partial [Helicobacter sp.]|nr:class I tRNA ligase family protein [Helicobacter sp.]